LKHVALVMVVVVGLTIGCHRSTPSFQPVIDPVLAAQAKEEILSKANESFEQRNWKEARRLYKHIYDAYPNDPDGRVALLRVADTYYEQGGEINLIEAQYKYRDFINRYPGSQDTDYAMLQIAMVSFKQMERPDRDQTKTKDAIQKLIQMIEQYPDSDHREEAARRLLEAKNRLAKHEHLVARFYIRRGACRAANGRLNDLVDDYPDYDERDGVFFDLGRCLERLGRIGEARLYYERVVSEFPESQFAVEAKERLSASSS